jgi:hypothetical protein
MANSFNYDMSSSKSCWPRRCRRSKLLSFEEVSSILFLLSEGVAAISFSATESAFIPFVSFGDLDNNTFKGLTSLLSVEQEIQYDEHT